MKPDRVVLFPYKMGSAGGKLMAEALGIKRVFRDKEYNPRPTDLIINWGSGHYPMWDTNVSQWLNQIPAVCRGISKIDAFYCFMKEGVSTPVWTQHRDWAAKWLAKGEMAVVRTELEGFDGSGILLVKAGENLPAARLYTKYVPITQEFRVYVFRDKVIDVLEKKRKIIAEAHPLIRTESLGWVFCQDPDWWPEEAEAEAIKAIKAVGLDFGGVDVIWNKDQKKCFVLEVNSAPGVYGRTPGKYAKVMKSYIDSL